MTDQDAAIASLMTQSSSWIDEYNPNPLTTLTPAFSVHGSRAYSVTPAMRVVEKHKTTGKGASKKIEVWHEEEPQMVVVTSDWKWLPYEPEVLKLFDLAPYAKPFIPMPPYRWHAEDAIKYVKERQTGRSTKDLWEELIDIWKAHAEYGELMHYKLLALYVLQTYLYTIWPATGYLHFSGTAGSGKSRSLQILEQIGYNGRSAMSISPSAMFRTINGNPGVLCIDESETFKSEEEAKVYKLLLGGYDKHGKAIINDKVNDEFRPTAYVTYCPKAIASINLLDSTLGSRTLVIPMVPALRQPEELPDDSHWRYLRHDLHVWALQNAVSLERLSRAWDSHERFSRAKSLVNRAWQIARPYVILAESFDPQFADDMIDWFNGYYTTQQEQMQDADRTMLLLRVLPTVIRTKPPKEDHAFSLKVIHDAMMDHLEEDQHDYYKSKHTNQYLLNLRVTPPVTINGQQHFVLDEDTIRQAFIQRMIEPFAEDKEWLHNGVTYYDAKTAEQIAIDNFGKWE